MINIFWFRRDLRLQDNHGLYRALTESKQVLPLFIFDEHILNDLENKDDARVTFIYQAIEKIHKQLQTFQSGLRVIHGDPLTIFKKLIKEYTISTVYCNRDYEPYARERDENIYKYLKAHNIQFKGYKDQVIFEKAEVVKEDGKPYTVFTPFSRKWKERLAKHPITTFDLAPHMNNFYKYAPTDLVSLASIGFTRSKILFPDAEVSEDLLVHYDQARNFPAKNGTSRLGVHLRFGTISIRQLVLKTQSLNEVFLNELIWREFYMVILYHFPKVVNHAFRAKYEAIPWRNDPQEFEAWCLGMTGYPIVDAGMRELVKTGYMHNRVRMITASFLTKHLLIDWRWGEAFFAKHLLDYELASNNGGWQWAAGTGCDAAPYFRVFNPSLQAKKFDAQQEYILKWVPEANSTNYPPPIVDHKMARLRAIDTYKTALN